MVKIVLEGQMPASEVEGFLQAVRSWERARPEIQMAIRVEDMGDKIEHAEEIMRRLTPELPYSLKVPRK